jgi:tRNA (cytidine/uridine-2'-O-)-methyltransferase
MNEKQSGSKATPNLRLALYQPDIPQNAGTMMRMATCFDVPVDLIEPAGFPTGDRSLRRAGMDYLDAVALHRHINHDHFDAWRRAAGHRLVLLTTQSHMPHHKARFLPGDIIMVGRESAGVPAHVRDAAELRLRIPMAPNMRSLNVAVSAAIVLGEAMRQLGLFDQLSGD